MKIRLRRLDMNCRQSIESLDLDHGLLAIVGEINTGKSTALHLIDFCLGANTPYQTEALRKEFLSATLELSVEQYHVILERELNSKRVSVTWRAADGQPRYANVPLQASPNEPQVEPGVITLSDLSFFLTGRNVVKVRQSISDEESPLIRLSFRDLMFYCFVRQQTSDSNFFHLNDHVKTKSREALKFVCGLYSPHLTQLTLRLEALQKKRDVSEYAIAELARILEKVNDEGSLEELRLRETFLEAELERCQTRLTDANRQYERATHVADEMRAALRVASEDLAQAERATSRQRNRLDELSALRSEFYSLKYKADRSQVALSVIGDIQFNYCPQCTRDIGTRATVQGGNCPLCKSSSQNWAHLSPEFLEATRQDLNARLAEVEATIARQEVSLQLEDRKMQRMIKRKQTMDHELSDTLRRYDADYLSRFRVAERELAQVQGELNEVTKLRSIHEKVNGLGLETAEVEAEASHAPEGD
ncbi:MAG TPA: AAA family ATPase [Candidatus Tumulicola sp.]|jgi:DNA repair ATPase RecN